MRVRLRLLLPILAAAAALSAPAAQAGLISGVVGVVLPTCGTSTHPFAQFGDFNGYYPLANNGFENGSAGWTLPGAGISKDHEPWRVDGDARPLGSRRRLRRPLHRPHRLGLDEATRKASHSRDAFRGSVAPMAGTKAATPWGPAKLVDELTVNQQAGERRFASIVQLL